MREDTLVQDALTLPEKDCQPLMYNAHEPVEPGRQASFHSPNVPPMGHEPNRNYDTIAPTTLCHDTLYDVRGRSTKTRESRCRVCRVPRPIGVPSWALRQRDRTSRPSHVPSGVLPSSTLCHHRTSLRSLLEVVAAVFGLGFFLASNQTEPNSSNSPGKVSFWYLSNW